jgi:surface-adhesin protein E
MPFSTRPFRRFSVHCSMANISAFWLLIMLLVLRSGPVYAEWLLVNGDDEAGLTVYVDPDTIRRKENLVTMLSLIDYRTIQIIAGDSLLSIQRQNEYDCAEARTRMLAFTWFSGNMGGGQVVHSDSDEDKWKPVAPDSVAEALWKIACGKE